MEIHNSLLALMVSEGLPAGWMLNLAVWGHSTQTPPSLSTTPVSSSVRQQHSLVAGSPLLL